MEQGVQLAPLPTEGRWECTRLKFSGPMLMMDTVESDEDSGLPSAAGREARPTISLLSHLTYDAMLPSHPLFMFIIGICSSSFMLMIVSRPHSQLVFAAPLVPPPPPLPHQPIVYSSVHTPSLRVSTLGRNDRLSLIPFPPSSSLLFWYGSHQGFLFCRVVLSLSHLHVTVAIPNPLVRTAVKYNIFNQ